ncbi:autotransporter outer membrane beta-barrel domain-containing protein [Helicobacter burdigaliensis]|uniref:autotransporter outer membrane beta-barrel domain-containing protein n=1 Tax=Helicobacter burdigaliensis TaxID=2315334 RepID=UPI000EF6D2D6|nr:autotransporter outer membrane beta-barrel domain-containing protein [Helicobacter burdigaliensis]
MIEENGKIKYASGSQVLLRIRNGAKVDSITNNGELLGGSASFNKAIIQIEGSSKVGTFANNGLIKDNAYGVQLSGSSTMDKLVNTGEILSYNGIYLSGTNTLAELDNQNKIQANKYGVDINASSKITTFNNTGTISGGQAAINLQGTITTLNNEGTIGKIQIGGDSGKITTLENKNGGTLDSIVMGGKASIETFNNEANINNIAFDKESHIGTLTNKSGGNIGGITIGNTAYLTKLENNENGSISGITLKNESYITDLNNNGSITAVTLNGSSSIKNFNNQGNFENRGENYNTALRFLGTSTIDKFINVGKVYGDWRALDGTGSIKNLDNSGEISSQNIALALYSDGSNHGKIETLENQENGLIKGEEAGINVVNNASIDTLNNSGKIESAKDGIRNAGTITTLDNKQSGEISSILNTGTITTLKNEGTISKFVNVGEITNGIDNKGTLVVGNFDASSLTLRDGSSDIITGKFGKTSDGYHFKNNGTDSKLSINGWYFSSPNLNTQELRDKEAIVIGGDNIAGISADKIYVGGANMNVIYDSNTFFVDKDGNTIGNNTNNGNGIDANNIQAIDGLFKFVNAGETGKYTAYLLEDELSGKTLAKSIIQSSRMRQINTNNILKDINSKNFKTDFTDIKSLEQAQRLTTLQEETNNAKKRNGLGETTATYDTHDILREFEEIFLPQKDHSKDIYTFLVPYYNYSSLDLEDNLGRLKVDTTGIIGGAQKKLDNEKGILGFYLGYENAKKEQQTQRLDIKEDVYYVGLTYHNTFLREGIKEYYLNITTRLDYTKSDLDKTYLNRVTKINTKADIYGYGLETKLGANFFNLGDIAMLSPEIGLSYMGLSSKDFTLNHLGGTKEHYYATQNNFVDLILSLKYQRAWNDRLRFNGNLGTLINLYNDAKGEVRVNNTHLSTDVKSSGMYAFSTLGTTYTLADNIDLSLNYGVVLADAKSYSHNLYLKLGVWW